MKKFAILTAVLLPLAMLVSSFTHSALHFVKVQRVIMGMWFPPPPPDGNKIKIALLLDTSNSMDGLIEQAKSQLWKLVNELATFKYGNETPQLEIALYEYGNDGLNSSEGYIRQVSMFTNDLDVISEKLFALKTNGGSEFCGHVIRTSLQQLDWNNAGSDLQIIFIAGNEPFTQGNVSYQSSCGMANEKGVFVNTIFCGSYDEGVLTDWKKGASLANGSYMNLDHNQKTVYVETPFDDAIASLNNKLNDTYVYYGVSGSHKKSMQYTQDKNASSYGSANTVERTVSKSSSFYKNYSWDLVDAVGQKEFDITKVKEENLPKELQGKTTEYKLKYIADRRLEREAIKNEIQALNKKRTAFILEKQKSTNAVSSGLDAVMLAAIKDQAVKRGFGKN